MARILGLTAKAFVFDIVFTIVEIVTMVLWLRYALLPNPSSHIVAIVILSVGLLIEHTVSMLAARVNTF